MKRKISLFLTAALFCSAVWTVSSCKKNEVPEYTVTFNSNGGTPTPPQQIIKEGGKVEKPADPSRENYGFAGWANADDETSALWNFATGTVIGDMTLYARWTLNTYAVTFDSDGGSAVPTQTIAHGSTATKPTDPTRNGYVFDNWYNGETEWNFATAITAPITLKAKWTAVYTVTFDSNGGSVVATQNVVHGFTALRPEDPTLEGYAFDGWFYDETEWDFTTAITASITLTAKWTEVYVVTFDSDGGTSVASQNVADGLTATRPTDPTLEGYAFDGWFYDGTEWDFATAITASITLTANWTAMYIVTFDSDGGSSVPSQTIRDGGMATKPATNPTKANYVFIEWRKDGEEIAFDFNTPIIAPITLKAIWESLEPVVTVTSEGTLLQRSTLARKLGWLSTYAQSHNTYIIEVSANEDIAPHTLGYSGLIDVTIIIRGDVVNRTFRLDRHGNMFTINSNVTLVLDKNVTLQGHSQNTGVLVYVNGGIFKMNDEATITGNSNIGVYVVSGSFEMNGGTISNNTASYGAGVDVRGTFTMNSGTISGNNATNYGGGVYIDGGTFTMNGGTISDNKAPSGGGVYMNRQTFVMNGGTISGNIANRGGGVYINQYYGTFSMRGGTITSNTAVEYGGGVYFSSSSSLTFFSKTGGIITGYSSDPIEGNVVFDGFRVLDNRGHAIYYVSTRRKETTSGQLNNLSNSSASGWD